MFGMVRDNVMNRTQGKQEPYVYGTIGGQQLFLVPPQPGAPGGAGDAKEQELWDNVKDSKVDAMLSLYLQLYPKGTHVGEARERLAALGKGPVTPSTDPSQWPQPGATPEPALSGEIVIAAAGPLTGPDAVFGNQIRQAAESAVADINEAGGVLGKRLKLVIADDASDPKTAIQVANKFVGEGVQFVLGHFGSGNSIPASEVYEENGVIMISPTSTNVLLTSRGQHYIFRVSPRDDHQGTYAGNFLARYYGDKRIAVIQDGTLWGKVASDGMLQAMQRLGKEAVLYESFQQGQDDYSALVARLKDARADIVYIGSLHADAALILRQMRSAGMKALMVGTDGLMTEEFGRLAGKAAEGTLMTFNPDPRKLLEAGPVVQRFRASGIEPDIYTLYAYAAVQAWAEAANRAQTTDAAKVANMLRTGRFTTTIGTVGFDAAGDVTIPGYAFYRWSKGKFAQLD
jgi:branched-chain amino acid transport system substrate-binding protein